MLESLVLVASASKVTAWQKSTEEICPISHAAILCLHNSPVELLLHSYSGDPGLGTMSPAYSAVSCAHSACSREFHVAATASLVARWAAPFVSRKSG